MVKGRIFSGMQPSGNFHLGNYLGALSNWVKLQHEYECFFCIVDWHALTSSFEDPSRLPDQIKNMALDWLSAGLDPEKNRIFIQSHVKEHAELHLLLSMMTPLLHHGMLIVGIPFTQAALNRTTTGGTPYGASHVAGVSGENPLSEDERILARALGRRVAETCARLQAGA